MYVSVCVTTIKTHIHKKLLRAAIVADFIKCMCMCEHFTSYKIIRIYRIYIDIRGEGIKNAPHTHMFTCKCHEV